MTHDFATIPRYVEPSGSIEKTDSGHGNSPFQLRWLLVAVALCFSIWLFLKPSNNQAVAVTPDPAEIIEYQKEMEEAYLVDDSIVLKEGEGAGAVDSSANSESKVTATSTIEYGFYDNLRNSQWAVQTQNGAYVGGELSKRKKVKYKLQAASFRNKNDALRLVKKLSAYGMQASARASISTNGLEWYQVSVGPFTNVSKMNKAQDILVSLNMMPLKKKI